jgi:hypothetical protein
VRLSVHNRIHMETIIKRYVKEFGYTPTIPELHSLYAQGMLRLSDLEENTLIRVYKNL